MEIKFKSLKDKCQISENSVILKLESLKDLPKEIEERWFGKINLANKMAQCHKIIDGNIIDLTNEIENYNGMLFISDLGFSYIRKENVLPFMEKSSKFYIVGNDYPLIIVNKKACYIIQPMVEMY